MHLRLIFTTLLFSFSFGLQAQEAKEVVDQFFSAMAQADGKALSELMVDNAVLFTSSVVDGNFKITSTSKQEFVRQVSSAVKGDLDERTSSVKEQRLDEIAVVTMDYDFYYKKSWSHCGVDVFTLMKNGTTWKITTINDTRKTTSCGKTIEDAANKLLDDWHLAAAKADSMAYFSVMTDDAVFVGTDSSEVWRKDAFISFAAPHFAKGKAWDFKKISRHVHYEKEKNMVWFDEMIATWMGPCRGSGWLTVEGSELKIKQYVLSVTVPNDKIKGFLKAME